MFKRLDIRSPGFEKTNKSILVLKFLSSKKVGLGED